MWRGKDTRGSTTLANSKPSARAGRLATRKEVRLTRNDACSIACHTSDCIPSMKSAGMCHPTSVAAAASQQTVGCVSAFPSCCTGAERNSGRDDHLHESLR